jgi:hypothetical protein
MFLRRLAAPLILAIALASLTTTTALAATVSSQYSVNGYEYYATSTQGRFAGTATGNTGDSATWRAVINHSPLTTAATITGGYADLATSRFVAIHGTFASGTVTLVSQEPGCGTQTYRVTGSLVNVTRSDRPIVGTAGFQAVLIHYRTSVFGSCLVYSARVSGVIDIRF